MRELYIPGKTTPQNQISNDKVSVGTTTQTDISTNENLFGTMKQPSISSGSSLGSTGNVFETTAVPSKDAYNYAKSVGGTVYEDQKRSLGDTLNKLLKLSAIALPGGPTAYGIAKLIENKGRNIKSFGLNVAGGFETNAAETARGLSTLAGKKELAQGIKSVYEKDVEETKWGQAIEQEDIFTNIGQKDWEGMWGNIGYQAGNMLPSILANVAGSLTGVPVVGKITGGLTLFPSMFQEAYDVYSEDPNITDTEAYVGAIIAGILMSAIEQVGGLEDLTKKGGLKGLAKNIKSPILRYLATYGIEVGAEGFEEIFQKIVMDATQGILSGKPGQQINSWDKLLTYIKDLGKVGGEASVISGFMVGAPTYVSLKGEIAQEEKEKEATTNRLIRGIARDSNSLDEFKEATEIFNKSEEELEDIWIESNLLTPEGTEKVYNTPEYQNYNQKQEEQKINEDIETAETEELMEKMDELEEMQRQQQKSQQQGEEKIDDIEKQIEKQNEILQQQQILNEALDLTTQTKTPEITQKPQKTEDLPKLVYGKYIAPTYVRNMKSSSLGEGISDKASRGEIEKDVRKVQDDYKQLAIDTNSLISFNKILKGILGVRNKATKDDIDRLNNSAIPEDAKETISRSLQNNSITDTIGLINDIILEDKKALSKLRRRYDRLSFERIYKIKQESKDNDIISFSDFVLKHKLKRGKTSNDAKAMVAGALEKMSKLFNLDVRNVFEGCKIIFIDMGGKDRENAWGSMQGFIDGSGTPIIPIKLNYRGWKESTVIHELVHGMDFVYQYRHGGVEFKPYSNGIFKGDFKYTLREKFPQLLKDLRYNMNAKEFADNYWKSGTEIMSRVFQEYYEYNVEHNMDTLTDAFHWKDIKLVEKVVNNLVDLYRKEFGLSPIMRGGNISEYVSSINNMIDYVCDYGTYNLFDAMSKVGHELNMKQIELWRETDVNKRKEIQAQLSELNHTWNMLQQWGHEITDVMMGDEEGKGGIQEELRLLNDDVLNLQKDVGSFLGKLTNESEKNIEGVSGKSAIIDEGLVDKREEVFKKGRKEKQLNLKQATKEAAKDVTMSVWTRLYNIDPKLAGSLSVYEGRTMVNTAKYNTRVSNYIKKVNELDKKTKLEFKKKLFDYGADENADVEEERTKILEFAKDHGFEDEMKEVFLVLEEIANDAQAAGLKITRKDMYYPRNVDNYKLLKEYLTEQMLQGKGDIEYRNQIKDLLDDITDIENKNIPEADKNRRLRNILEQPLRGKRISKSAFHQKRRKITSTKDWGDEIILYYEDPEEAIMGYISNMVERTERARFFARGVGIEGLDVIYDKVRELNIGLTDKLKDLIREYMQGYDVISDISEYIQDIGYTFDEAVAVTSNLISFIDSIYEEDTENSINNMVKQLKDKNFSEEKQKELGKLLNSYFNRQGTPAIVSAIKDISYALYLGNLTSTITQMSDISFSIMQGGMLKTAKAIFRKAELNVQEIGIESLFDDIKHDKEGWYSSLLNTILSKTGFKKVDIGMKTLFLQTTLETFIEQANNNSDILKARLELLYGSKMADEMFNAYKEGNVRVDKDGVSELNVVMMIDLLQQLGSVQPIMKSSATVWYNNRPEARLVYTMKTFALKVVDLLVHGAKRTYDVNIALNKTKAQAMTASGLYVLRGLSLYIIGDIAVQLLRDMLNSLPGLIRSGLTGEGEPELWRKTFIYQWVHNGFNDAMKQFLNDTLEALGTLVFMNEYTKFAWQTTGAQGVVGQMLTPPIASFITTIVKVLTGDKGSLDWLYNIPGIGSMLYYSWAREWGKKHKLWHGRGSAKKI